MTIANDLEALNAPPKVIEAGVLCDAAFEALLSPPSELVTYIRNWVTRNQGNNRYGR